MSDMNGRDVLIVGAGPVAWRCQFALRRHESGVYAAAVRCRGRCDSTRTCGALQEYPLKIFGVEQPNPAIFYGGALILSRPDQHVAWRGDRLPPNPPALII
jgi:hypothetical protein